MDRDKIIEILEKELPDFLYKGFNDYVTIGEHGDTVVQDKWDEYCYKIADKIKALEPNADEIEKACIDFVKRTGYKGKGQKVLAHTIYRWGANFVKNFKR